MPRAALTATGKTRRVIIGAGFAGIGAAVRLRPAGFRRLTLLDRAGAPGGTWWHNRYHGAEVDTPSVLYSFSWMPWNWTRTHVGQEELQAYLAAMLERCDLTGRCRFGFDVGRVEWHEGNGKYSIHSGSGEVVRAKYVISAVGQVTIFRREPGWIVPKMARPFTERERWALDSRAAQRIFRTLMIYKRDKAQFRGAVWRPGTPQNTGAEAAARACSLEGSTPSTTGL